MLEQQEALQKLRELIGKDLRPLAEKHNVTVWTGKGTLNKGWVGQTVELELGIPTNSSQNPDGGTWELKTASLKRLTKGGLRVKETLAITMINAHDVAETAFSESHLLAKLHRLVVLARVWESSEELTSIVHGVVTFDLDDPDIYQTVQSDYNLVKKTIETKGFSALSGNMGELVQPRTKGAGHGSTSRAFYARTCFVKRILGI